MTLPADSHVHSEWSWDTGGPDSFAAGRMVSMCERAVAIGLPAVVFTEHFDFDDVWRTTRDDLMPHQQSLLDPDGISGHRHWRCRVTSRASTVAVVDSPN